eukprot:scaffold334_cov241-Pinguiococcus_pyrenoidosus.AAC.63
MANSGVEMHVEEIDFISSLDLPTVCTGARLLRRNLQAFLCASACHPNHLFSDLIWKRASCAFGQFCMGHYHSFCRCEERERQRVKAQLIRHALSRRLATTLREDLLHRLPELLSAVVEAEEPVCRSVLHRSGGGRFKLDPSGTEALVLRDPARNSQQLLRHAIEGKIRLQVKQGCAVHQIKTADANAPARQVDLGNLHDRKPDRIDPMRRARAEDPHASATELRWRDLGLHRLLGALLVQVGILVEYIQQNGMAEGLQALESSRRHLGRELDAPASGRTEGRLPRSAPPVWEAASHDRDDPQRIPIAHMPGLQLSPTALLGGYPSLSLLFALLDRLHVLSSDP